MVNQIVISLVFVLIVLAFRQHQHAFGFWQVLWCFYIVGYPADQWFSF